MNADSTRHDYLKAELNRDDLESDPFLQFEKWFKEASDSEIIDPNAFGLATVSNSGVPFARTVLLKIFDEKGLVFFTNYQSSKAKQIAENPNVAALFLWRELERQVSINGIAKKISTAESLKYFSTRPRGSQLGAWISEQSSVISSRKLLEQKYQEIKNKFSDGAIPLPDFWGGYRIVPKTFEFWQGRKSRLNDRFLYSRNEKGDWKIERLAP